MTSRMSKRLKLMMVRLTKNMIDLSHTFIAVN